MKFILIFFCTITISSFSYGNEIFETKEYEINFTSNNINQEKNKRIDEIKIKSFKNLISKILTFENIKKIDTKDLNFINKFILNYKINAENIINNNYYSKIKINFNKKLVIDYLVKNKIQFIDQKPEKFLLIIFEQNKLKNYLLSKENSFYKYLSDSSHQLIEMYFLIPNLDYNDRFIMSENDFINDSFKKNKLLNKKYNTDYQILIHSKRNKNLFFFDVYLYFDGKKYFITKIPTNSLNYDELFNKISNESVNMWKKLNQINTSLTNKLECKILINNINELSFVRGLLKSNIYIKDLILTSIDFNKNSYEIYFFGKIAAFQNSLKKSRLNLFFNDNECNIKII